MKAVKDMNPQPEQNSQSLASTIAEAIAKAGISRVKGGSDYTWLTEGLKAIAPALAPIGMALAEKICSSTLV